jgi:hypothetical protein
MDSQNRSVAAAAAVFAGYSAGMFVPERGMKSTGGPGIIAFELAGTEARAMQIMDSWGERGRRAARTSLKLDFGYAASYGVLTALLLDRIRQRHDDSPLVVLVAGRVVGYAVIPRDSSPGVTLQAMAAGARDGVTASLAVSDEPWGTRLDWQCQYTKAWATNVKSYDLVVTTKEGAESTVASWRPSGDAASNLAAATTIPKSEIQSVVIREAGTATPLAVTTLA